MQKPHQVFLRSTLVLLQTSILAGISVTMKRHHNHGSYSKGKHLIEWITDQEIQSIIIIVKPTILSFGHFSVPDFLDASCQESFFVC